MARDYMTLSPARYLHPAARVPAPERSQELVGEEESAFTNEGAPPPGIVGACPREPVRVSYVIAQERRVTRPILSLSAEASTRRNLRHPSPQGTRRVPR